MPTRAWLLPQQESSPAGTCRGIGGATWGRVYSAESPETVRVTPCFGTELLVQCKEPWSGGRALGPGGLSPGRGAVAPWRRGWRPCLCAPPDSREQGSEGLATWLSLIPNCVTCGSHPSLGKVLVEVSGWLCLRTFLPPVS